MIQLILMMSMTASQAQDAKFAQVQPCNWPNRCAVEAPILAQVQPCNWPNKCAVEPPLVNI